MLICFFIVLSKLIFTLVLWFAAFKFIATGEDRLCKKSTQKIGLSIKWPHVEPVNSVLTGQEAGNFTSRQSFTPIKLVSKVQTVYIMKNNFI